MLRQLPNMISLFRIVLVWPIVDGLLTEQFVLAWWLFVVAGISDGVDGYLARRFDWRTDLGATLDPLGDKLLLVSSYLVLGWLAQLPVWLVVLVILRDIIIIAGTMIYQRITGDKVIQPLMISKINTVAQILLVTVVIFSLAYWALPMLLTQIFIYIVALTTLSSGVSYMVVWTRRAHQTVKGRQEQ